MSLIEQVKQGKLPRHIAIIMDGNGRWAQMQGQERTFGHSQGVTPVREVIEGSAELGISYLTLYAFSTENWSRPRKEIDALMSLLVSTLNTELSTMVENNIRLRLIGDLERFSPDIYRDLMEGVHRTAGNSGLTVQIALSYSGRWDIMQAVRHIAGQVRDGALSPAELTEDLFARHLATAGVPDPELLIRTSGEVRISNFLLWQCAYTELYFTPTLWPDFRRDDLYRAILDYQHRERRFGKTSAQVQQNF